ncbi:MAG: FAD-containing oxidoreductase [Kiritimatiellae bacterium]|nr:FAD-containing oxidoreductase [Kiritimatiellia bacterium]
MTVEMYPIDNHNEKLIANVHPADWKNPEPNNPYNLVVVGAGTAGLVSAAAAAGLGARVALIERSLMGGDCLNYGCVPSKGIIRAATACSDVHQAGNFGIDIEGEVRSDFGKVMERMRALRAQISKADSVSRFKELGVDLFLGEGRFTSPRTLGVDGKELRFSKAVVATGARASAPPIPGLEHVTYLNNETLFNLTAPPKRLAVIGAGPIGCEMAQTFQRLGTDVTLIELSNHILIKEDADAAEIVQQALIHNRVTLALNAEKIIEVKQDGPSKSIQYFCGKTQQTCTVTANEILVAVGRAPNVEDMGLEQAGVEFDLRKGVKVNDQLQTTNTRIYAAGDVCSKYQFTHAADFLARTVIANALFAGRQKVSALTIPWCTYTDPQIAHVGITEHEASQHNIEIDTYKQPLEDVDRAILDGETEGFVKIHVAKGKDKILGATIVARHAGDMIGELVMAITHKLGLGSVSKVIHPYPTQAEAIRRTGDLYSRTRLTPIVKKVMSVWFRWTRKR